MAEREARGWRIERVVCAVDLSSASDEALRQAGELASGYGAELIALHVLPRVTRSSPFFPQLAQAEAVDFVAVERRVLEELHARVVSATGRAPGAFRIELGTGAPDAQIVEQAERLAADVIVVGSGPVHAGVTARVSRHAHCPVWVARPRPNGGRVLIATDFSGPSSLALQAGLDLARRLGAAVTAAHAVETTQILSSAAAVPAVGAMPIWVTPDLRELREGLAKRLESELGGAGEIVVEERLPAELILELARSLPAALICMGTTGRSGLARVLVGSVAEEVVRNAPCPVLVTRVNARTASSGLR